MPFRTRTTAVEALSLVIQQGRSSKQYLTKMRALLIASRKLDDVYRMQQHFFIVRTKFQILSNVSGLRDTAKTMFNDVGYDVVAEIVNMRSNMKILKDILDTLIPVDYIPPTDDTGNIDKISNADKNAIVSLIDNILVGID